MSYGTGRIEVICGSMFCGKSEELIRRSRRAQIAKQCIQVFKPIIDDRYSVDRVSTHYGDSIEAIPVNDASEIRALVKEETTVVAIDEAQFFDMQLTILVMALAYKGVRVIIAGLDTDFRGEPFGQMPILMSIAEDVTKLHAICVICGNDASRTQRMVNGKPALWTDPIVLIGATESYEARCRFHHEVPKF